MQKKKKGSILDQTRKACGSEYLPGSDLGIYFVLDTTGCYGLWGLVHSAV